MRVREVLLRCEQAQGERGGGGGCAVEGRDEKRVCGPALHAPLAPRRRPATRGQRVPPLQASAPPMAAADQIVIGTRCVARAGWLLFASASLPAAAALRSAAAFGSGPAPAIESQ